jgi:UDP-N-acetylglucosamine--N-acetylmuramyl-(pentapeptide) pyrophosphoryl-undecaprenol N-acetylglucosamine transferase
MSAPVAILAGGTGGHIFPGLAVADALRERGVPVLWIGARGRMETRLVPAHGVPIEVIDIAGVRGKGALALLAAPMRLLRAAWQARALLRQAAPRAVISFGGFAAGPGGIAAWLLGLPLLVHEQNSRPGVTNRVLARLARRVLQGFPASFPAARRAQTVGNPVRAVIAALPPPAQRLSGREGATRLLVLGGSQGARALNLGAPMALKHLGGGFEVRHQCGETQREATADAYAEAGVEARIEPFIADMAEAYGWADVVLCRAGALTLAEVCAAGVASVLVPLPSAADDHQTGNAQHLVEHGAAVRVAEGDGFAARLARELDLLRADPALRLSRAAAARALARSDAARAVADAILAEAAA